MAGMRAVHKKNGTTFKYSGDLKDFIKLAKEELAKREEAAGHGRDNTNP